MTEIYKYVKFWIYCLSLCNFLFQINVSLFTSYEAANLRIHLVNSMYWMVTVVSLLLCKLATDGSEEYIVYAMAMTSFRNCLPMYNLDGTSGFMSQANENIVFMTLTILTFFNAMILNLSFLRVGIISGLLLLFAAQGAMVKEYYSVEDLKQWGTLVFLGFILVSQ